tara:strand:- start:4360 stop:5061 length:702 start_codon:yes stop_codon:yes gene_type:complete
MLDFINIQYPDGFDISKYEGKRILVVGAGPTTNIVKWENIEYDYVFTCNQYTECNKLDGIKIEVASLINRILKKSNPIKLHKRLNRDNSYVAIEPYHSSMVFGHITFKELVAKYKNKCLFFDTTFQNKSGAAPRLAILAAALKPKSICMVGIDGYGNASNLVHSFDKDLVGIRDGNSYESVNNAQIEFAIYIHKLCSKLKIELFNLSEGHPENVMSSYSKTNFPLSNELKEQL